LPETVFNLFGGESPILASLATTRSFTLWALTAALVAGVIILMAAPKLARGATAVVLAFLAFGFFGGYERLREGTRKPFLIHSHLFSNGLLVSDIGKVNEEGVLNTSGWAARGSEDLVAIGRRVFRTQCSSCHTRDGYQSIRAALPTFADMYAMASEDSEGSTEALYAAECAACHRDISSTEMAEMLPSAEEMTGDPEMIHDLVSGMISGTLVSLHEMGDDYTGAPKGVMIDTSGFFAPYMPPLVGTDDELEALSAYLSAVARDEDAPFRHDRSGGVE
jgi:mono/diheme cytochrome c family protein